MFTPWHGENERSRAARWRKECDTVEGDVDLLKKKAGSD